MPLNYVGVKVNYGKNHCDFCGAFMSEEYYYFITLVSVSCKVLRICENCENKFASYDK